MILLIDNYDSFTYNLTDYLAQLGEETLVLRNDETDAASVLQLPFSRLLISPGPNRPSEAGNLMSILEVCCHRVPVLGICLGHQAIGEFFGAELVHADRPMHGKVSELIHTGEGIYEGLPQRFNVCRYHSLLLKSLENTPLKQTAWTDAGECMGFAHNTLPVSGIQYHPEAILTEHGLDLLRNWLRLTDYAVS
jgi:anthranilate synthase/aminodeoxychorismate synthase-like glutamine amidotransferase